MLALVLQPPNARAGETPRANSETEAYKEVGHWLVGIDHTMGGGCFIIGKFDDVLLRIGVDARQKKLSGYFILLGNEWTSIERRADYPIEVAFGSEPPWKVTAHGTEMGGVKGIIVGFDEGSVFEAFSKAQELRVKYEDKPVARLTFDGASEAVDAMVECQSPSPPAKSSRDPFAR